MKSRDTGKAIKALKRLCKKNGIVLEVANGRGSHVTLVFIDPETGKSIKLVVAGHGEISPGVQRDIIKYTEDARKWVGLAGLAAKVGKLLLEVFSCD